MRYDLNDYHVKNIGKFTRKNIEQWLSCNAGDFSKIVDFQATIGEKWIEWNSEENECKFNDCMYSEE